MENWAKEQIKEWKNSLEQCQNRNEVVKMEWRDLKTRIEKTKVLCMKKCQMPVQEVFGTDISPGDNIDGTSVQNLPEDIKLSNVQTISDQQEEIKIPDEKVPIRDEVLEIKRKTKDFILKIKDEHRKEMQDLLVWVDKLEKQLETKNELLKNHDREIEEKDELLEDRNRQIKTNEELFKIYGHRIKLLKEQIKELNSLSWIEKIPVEFAGFLNLFICKSNCSMIALLYALSLEGIHFCFGKFLKNISGILEDRKKQWGRQWKLWKLWHQCSSSLRIIYELKLATEIKKVEVDPSESNLKKCFNDAIRPSKCNNNLIVVKYQKGKISHCLVSKKTTDGFDIIDPQNFERWPIPADNISGIKEILCFQPNLEEAKKYHTYCGQEYCSVEANRDVEENIKLLSNFCEEMSNEIV